MPYSWDQPDSAPQQTRLTLWPHRSLPPQGFAAFILITFALLMLPVLGLLGRAELWGILPFALGVLWLTWALLRRNYRDGALTEILTLDQDRAELVRLDPGGQRRVWQANPYWIRVVQHTTGPVATYLTLTGGDREVEIGAFLSPDERARLKPEIEAALARLR
jgi:uncharacterized membrane protein